MEIKKIAILGAGGQMGSYFAKFFAKQKSEVFVSDLKKEKLFKFKKYQNIKICKDNKQAVKFADFILISVLIEDFENLIKEIAPFLRKNQKILDICSLKEFPLKIMHKFLKKNLILGTHPLFGPQAKKKNLNFILTPTNPKEKKFAKEFKIWLEKRNFKVKLMSPKEHDKLMTLILGIPHFVGLTAGSFYLDNFSKENKDIFTPSFEKLLTLIKSVAFSSPKFYSKLHFQLPDIELVEREFLKKVKFWLKIVNNKNSQKFEREMIKIKKFFENVN